MTAEFNGFIPNSLPEFQWSELHRLEYELDAVLQAVKESINFNDKLILVKQQKLEKSAKEDPFLSSDVDNNTKGQYYGHHYGDYERAIDELNDVLLNANFLAIFAYFEGKLKETCELIEEKIKSNIKHSDLRADGDISQFMKFFNLILGLDLSNLKNDLEAIQKHKLIRNKIAHHNGTLPTANISTIKGIKHIRTVEYTKERSGVLIVSSQYLIELITLLEGFFSKLLIELDTCMSKKKLTLL